MKQPMYARVTLAQVRPGELKKTMGLLRDTLYPAFQRMPGFGGAFLLADPAAEKVCGVTLWESEDLVPRVTQAAAGPAGRATRRFFEAPPLERLATIPLAGQPDREVYRLSARLAAPQQTVPARARVLTARIAPGAVGRAADIARDVAPVAVGQQPGFRYFLALTQPDNGDFLAVTIWESEAHAAAWETGCRYRQLLVAMAPILDGAPNVDRYDVSVCL